MKNPNGNGRNPNKTALSMAIKQEQQRQAEKRNYITWEDVDKHGAVAFTLDGKFVEHKNKGITYKSYVPSVAILLDRDFNPVTSHKDTRIPANTKVVTDIEERLGQGHTHMMISDHIFTKFNRDGRAVPYHDFTATSHGKESQLISSMFK